MNFNPGIAFKEISVFCIVLFSSLLVRLLFFTGPFGSDEVIYIDVAAKILAGDWSVSSYNGATRYGINLPVAGFMWLFGVNEHGAYAWALVTSLIEVGIVMHLGMAMWGKRAGLFAGLLLAFLPLHVNHAGRAMADPPLALFISLSFYLFYWAERTKKTVLYLASGFAIGAVYWVKEFILTFSLVFLLFPLIWRRWNMQWLYIIAGSVFVVFANLLLFKILAGDFFYQIIVFETASKAFQESPYSRSLWFYFHYLFIDIRHTIFIGYLAALGCIAVLLKKKQEIISASLPSAGFILIWLLGLVLLYTFFVVKLSPLETVQKQTNYMLMFMVPMSLMGGYFISIVRYRIAWAVMIIYVATGTLVSGLEQQAVRNFTSNSKATLIFAKSKPGAIIYAGTNALNLNIYYTDVDPERAVPPSRLRPLAEAQCQDEAGTYSRYAIIDDETRDWSTANKGDISDAAARLAECLREEHVLTPVGFGIGRDIVLMTGSAAALIPGQLGEQLSLKINAYAAPKPAIVYAIEKNEQGHPHRK